MEPALARALDAYEDDLVAVVRDGPFFERAAALQALADVASPRYTTARDLLLEDTDPLVQAALLGAMTAMGDDSSEARHLAECSLRSRHGTVVTAAVSYFTSLELPAPFAAIWHSEHPPLSLCNQQCGSLCDTLTGVGAVRPWKDPAWQKISRWTQTSLLLRAGTSEAVALLRPQLDELAFRDGYHPYLKWAETGDVELMRSLLAEPDPTLRLWAAGSLIAAGHDLSSLLHDQDAAVRRYAARTLLSAGDPGFVRDIEEAILQADGKRVLPLSPGDISLELLSSDAIRKLLVTAPDLLYKAVRVLEARGEPLGADQLAGRSPVHGSQCLQGPPRGTTTFMISAVIRDRAFDVLPQMLDVALGNENTLKSLNDALWRAPGFLGELPDEVTGSCVSLLEAWIGENLPEDIGRWDRQAGLFLQTYRILGMLARGDDAERRWQRFRQAEQPLDSPAVALPVLWGACQRNEELRIVMAHNGGAWCLRQIPTGIGPLPAPLLDDGKEWDRALCQEQGVARAVLRPVQTPGRLHLRWLQLLDELNREYAGQQRRLIRDLLAYRGVDPADQQAMRKDKLRFVTESAAALARLPDVTPPPFLPGPRLGKEDLTWLEEVLASKRRQLVDHILSNPEREIYTILDSTPGRLRLNPPSSYLIREADIGIAGELRDLLDDPSPQDRHTAAWVLWRTLGEPAAVALLERDAADQDAVVRASALWALLAGGYRPAAALFPPLLASDNPQLRGIGLRGVIDFQLHEALPEVMNLLSDEDIGVAGAAAFALGELHADVAFELLLDLSCSRDPIANHASLALQRFRRPQHVAAVLARLETVQGDTDAAIRLTRALVGMTFHLMGPLDQPLVQSTPPEPTTVAAWRDWWDTHGSLPVSERARLLLVGWTTTALAGDTEQATAACHRLRPFFELDCRYLPAEREQLDPVFLTISSMLESGDLWEVLTSSRSLQKPDIELLMEIDPARTRRLLMACLGSFGYPRNNRHYPIQAHQELVRLAGEDLGDPAHAQCAYRDQVHAAWQHWLLDQEAGR